MKQLADSLHGLNPTMVGGLNIGVLELAKDGHIIVQMIIGAIALWAQIKLLLKSRKTQDEKVKI